MAIRRSRGYLAKKSNQQNCEKQAKGCYLTAPAARGDGVSSAAYEDRRRSDLAGALKLATVACAAAAWQVVRHALLKQVRLFLPARTVHSPDREGLAFTVVDEVAGERVGWQPTPIPADLLDAHPRGDAAG